ncbi:hypothetical protein Cgig2_022662 [Carnegiea gigantea]|uniref:Uncharacterized protein n=1 Tax=Carnegiea gigantea TaxID=171969 RepID=A0A9Q1JLA6_9CARY|nr:hypothetical protein Cgig2_022662 [Carnegiea gigantea]
MEGVFFKQPEIHPNRSKSNALNGKCVKKAQNLPSLPDKSKMMEPSCLRGKIAMMKVKRILKSRKKLNIVAARRVATVCLAGAVSTVPRERERERKRGAVRSPVFVAWESNAVIGGKPKTCWALGLREPPTSPSPAAGCSLLGFSRASGEFLRSCLRGVGFYSVEVTAGLVGGFCPRRLPLCRHISRRKLFRRPESRRIFAGALFLKACFEHSLEVAMVLMERFSHHLVVNVDR